MQKNLLLVDDHSIFRHGLERSLKSMRWFHKIIHASSGVEALKVLENETIDLVFMDIHMKEMGGIETTQKAIEKYPNLKIIALSQFDDKNHISQMMNGGAKGYLVKDALITEIKKAIKIVLNGGIYYSDEISKTLLKSVTNNQNIITASGIPFSRREIDILKLLCDKQNVRDIAEKIFISIRTVEWHKQNLMTKTNSKSVSNLLEFAIKEGYHNPLV